MFPARGNDPAVAEAMGYGKGFHALDDDTIRRFVGTRWASVKGYSETIWEDSERVAAWVQDDMAKALARGESWRSLCDELSRRFMGVSERDVMRLVVTEGTYVSRQAQLAELAREGFEEYRVEPVGDERTCEVCSALVGKAFPVDGARVGATLPPIHPRCRCQIAPAVDDWDAWIHDQVDLRQDEIAARRVGGDEAANPLHSVPCRGSVRYEKPKERLAKNEQTCVSHLESLGYQVEVLDEDLEKSANIDLRLGESGQLWEMKNVGDGKHAIEGNMRNAYHKWVKLGLDALNETKVVMTSYGGTRSESEIVDEIKRRMRKYAVNVIYIFKDGASSIFLRR